MGWWKADPVEPVKDAPPPPYQSQHQPSQPKLPAAHPPIASSAQADACPVDSKTREIWLRQAKQQKELQEQRRQQQQQQQQQQSQPASPAAQPTPPPAQLLPSTTTASKECSSDHISQSPTTEAPVAPTGIRRPLSHDREISSIPRAHPSTSTSSPSVPANSETETGSHASGNWIYPSETQFFNAVMRKATTNTSPHDLASSISSIIPIHNAVNERAWHLIKEWEGNSSARCGGPKLLSFEGKGAGALSPMAKWNTWVMGAREPFDRHDWVVERCGGEKVEYVIDFYQGQGADTGRRIDANLNFYLDVRPKMNSVEGCKMRAERFMGWR